MKVIFDKSELISAITTAMGAVSSKHDNPILECIKITAEYDENGRFKSAETEEIMVSEIVPVENTATHKVFYWNNLIMLF